MPKTPLGELNAPSKADITRSTITGWIFIITGLLTIFFFIGIIFIIIGIVILATSSAKKSSYWLTNCPYCKHKVGLRVDGIQLSPNLKCPTCKKRLHTNIADGFLEGLE